MRSACFGIDRSPAFTIKNSNRTTQIPRPNLNGTESAPARLSLYAFRKKPRTRRSPRRSGFLMIQTICDFNTDFSFFIRRLKAMLRFRRNFRKKRFFRNFCYLYYYKNYRALIILIQFPLRKFYVA